MLAEREAFLRAIFDAPDDDLPRLVYADWLEERGEELAARAVRLSIEWARSTGEERNRLHALGERFQEEHADLVRALGAVTRWPFSAPYYGMIHVTVRDLLDADRLRRKSLDNPYWFGSEIMLMRGHGDRITDSTAFDTIFGLPAFQKVRELHMPGEHVPVTGVVTDESGSVTEAPAYDFRIAPFITQAGVQALARCREARRLTLLDLRNHNLGNDALRFLADSPHFKNLKRLEVAEGNNFRGRVWQQLIERFGEDVVN